MRQYIYPWHFVVFYTGPVLCVRWAASGKWLASGSDDTLVMIWDLDP